MKIITHNNEIEIAGIHDFDLVKTFECGQCFRWDADKNGDYTGIVFGRVVFVRCAGSSIFITSNDNGFYSTVHDYFDLNRDYMKIRQHLSVDDFMCKATAFGEGIRILRQDKWEALCSFIISQNNNIPRIKNIIDTLCRVFGEKIVFDGKIYYTFPDAGRLAAAKIDDLAVLRCGYRAQYILDAAISVSTGAIDLDFLADASADTARSVLKKLRGVGDKVADCVLLFGFHKLDAFPVDVWMKRAVEKHYGPGFDPNIFSPYAGIAQQYIFYYTRNNNSC